MIVRFDAETLSKSLNLIRSAITATKGNVVEELLGISGTDNSFVAYGFGKNHWARVEIPMAIEQKGWVSINRQRFFQLLGLLKGASVFEAAAGAKDLEIKTSTGSGKLRLRTSTTLPPKPNQTGMDNNVKEVDAEPLYKLLKLCILDGELMGGGYQIKHTDNTLSVTACDGLRLAVAYIDQEANDFEFVIPPESVRGVFEVLRQASGNKVKFKSNHSLTSVVLEEDGATIEFGFQNKTAKFPDIGPLLKSYPNECTVIMDTQELLEVVNKAMVVAEMEYTSGELVLNKVDRTCELKVVSTDGSAALILEAVSDFAGDENKTIKLRLDFVKNVAKRIEDAGAEKLVFIWSEGTPVRWLPAPEEEIEASVIYVTTALS